MNSPYADDVDGRVKVFAAGLLAFIAFPGTLTVTASGLALLLGFTPPMQVQLSSFPGLLLTAALVAVVAVVLGATWMFGDER